MTLDKFRPYAKEAIDPAVSVFDRLGIGPDGVSVLALVMAVFAAVGFTLGGQINPIWYPVGALFVALNGWLDVIDGALAREQGVESAAGDFLDHVLDRYADILLIAGLAAGTGEFLIGFAAVTGVLMTSYLGTQSQAVGLERVYGGAVGRADRIALILVVAVLAYPLPGVYSGLTLVGWLLVFFAVVGHLTALQRFYHAWGALGE